MLFLLPLWVPDFTLWEWSSSHEAFCPRFCTDHVIGRLAPHLGEGDFQEPKWADGGLWQPPDARELLFLSSFWFTLFVTPVIAKSSATGLQWWFADRTWEHLTGSRALSQGEEVMGAFRRYEPSITRLKCSRHGQRAYISKIISQKPEDKHHGSLMVER